MKYDKKIQKAFKENVLELHVIKWNYYTIYKQRFSIGDVEKVDLSVNKYLLYDSWGNTVHITQGYMVSRVKFNVQ